MKSKLATWSWVLPIMGLFISVLLFWVSGGSPPTLKIIFFILGWVSLICFNGLGITFGVLALNKVSKKPESTGKSGAIIGIILSLIILIVLGGLMLLGLLTGG